MANAHDEIDKLINANTTKFEGGGKINPIVTAPGGDEQRKQAWHDTEDVMSEGGRVISAKEGDYKTIDRIQEGDYHKGSIKTVIEVPTPTEEKPGDTRLYLGEDDSWDRVLRESASQDAALEKWITTPGDSLTRGQYKELIKEDIVKDDIVKDDKKKKKKFFKRKKK